MDNNFIVPRFWTLTFPVCSCFRWGSFLDLHMATFSLFPYVSCGLSSLHVLRERDGEADSRREIGTETTHTWCYNYYKMRMVWLMALWHSGWMCCLWHWDHMSVLTPDLAALADPDPCQCAWKTKTKGLQGLGLCHPRGRQMDLLLPDWVGSSQTLEIWGETYWWKKDVSSIPLSSVPLSLEINKSFEYLIMPFKHMAYPLGCNTI